MGDLKDMGKTGKPTFGAFETDKSIAGAFARDKNKAYFDPYSQIQAANKTAEASAQKRPQNKGRVPWVFTCEHWMRGNLDDLKNTRSKIQNATPSASQDVSTAFNSQGVLTNGKPLYLFWAINPGEATWDVKQRGALQKNYGGTVYHAWKNPRRGTYFDEATLSLTLRTGNILPVQYDVHGRPEIPQGLSNFYLFLQLLNAPKIVGSDGRPNYVYIQYNSRLFPQVTLKGYIDPASLPFTDSKDDPLQVTSWSMNFVMVDSYPPLYNYTQLLSIFQEMGAVRGGRGGRLDSDILRETFEPGGRTTTLPAGLTLPTGTVTG